MLIERLFFCKSLLTIDYSCRVTDLNITLTNFTTTSLEHSNWKTGTCIFPAFRFAIRRISTYFTLDVAMPGRIQCGARFSITQVLRPCAFL